MWKCEEKVRGKERENEIKAELHLKLIYFCCCTLLPGKLNIFSEYINGTPSKTQATILLHIEKFL